MVRQAIDLVTHKLRVNTHWEDYYRFGFYRRDMPWSEKELYLSDHGSYYWPWEGNSLKFDRHPDTGEEISGQVVPYFEEARELALRACKVFEFMATIGWDVGITPEGPTIIEGNPAWHSRNYQDALGPFLTREIAAGLIPRKAWTPLDKTRMYPGCVDHADGGWRQRYLSARRKRLRLKALERLQQASRQ